MLDDERTEPRNADTAVYRAVKDDLTRFATTLVGGDAAQDVVSTVVARALAGGGLSRLVDPRVYLLRAVRNECRTVYRRRRREATLGATTMERPAGGDPDSDDGLVRLVQSLPPQQRAATFLVYWVGCTPTEAAHIMRVRPATLRRYLFLARQRVKEGLDAIDNG